MYDSPCWQALRVRLVREHINTYGPWCPGYGRSAHPSHDLTADHLVPISQGGEPCDPRNAAVLCRGCNARKRDRV